MNCTYACGFVPMFSSIARPAKSTGLPSRLLGFLTPSTGLLGGRTFLLVLKKIHFGIYNFFLILIYFLCGFTV